MLDLPKLLLFCSRLSFGLLQQFDAHFLARRDPAKQQQASKNRISVSLDTALGK